MKKIKILFVLKDASAGGSCTSMLNLLELLNDKGLQIDLFLMVHRGEFIDRAKSVARLIEQDILISSIIVDKKGLFKLRNFVKLLIRLSYVFLRKIFGSKTITIFFYKWSANFLSNKYDTIVAFQESMTTEYVYYIKSGKKIAWVHTDFSRFTKNHEKDFVNQIYSKFDKIVCVSNSVKQSIHDNLLNVEGKTELVYNTLAHNRIIEGSKEEFGQLKRKENEIVFVSVGRFANAKAFGRIIDVSMKLLSDGLRFTWLVVGDGELWDSVNKGVIENNLQDNVILLGKLTNPFPVVKFADVFVLTSLYEAHPMVVNEALILNKLVISTHFNSVKEVIEDRVTGIICENSIEGLYNGINTIIKNEHFKSENSRKT